MNLLDILQEIKDNQPNMWFRPVGWKTQAFTINKDQEILRVPSAFGGSIGFTYHLNEILKEWEIVDPQTVCDEYTAIFYGVNKDEFH